MAEVRIPQRVARDLAVLAHGRNDAKVGFNKHSSWRRAMDARGMASSLDQHLFGLCGEWATGQILGVTDVDRAIYQTHGDRGIGDLQLPDGRQVQVKTRAAADYDFALSGADPKELLADLAVLCWAANAPTSRLAKAGGLARLFGASNAAMAMQAPVIAIEVYAYATRQWFVDHCVVKNYGYGLRCVLEPWRFQQRLLRPIPRDLLPAIIK